MAAIVYTPEFVERGYNNRAAVPEYQRWLTYYTTASASAREALAPKELRYGPASKETLDLFLPAGRARGTFVFLHGGYWRMLDKNEFSFVATHFVAAGYAVAVVNYDLCPTVSIATIVDECRRAVVWLVREGASHGADPARIVVGGHSAGGHLTAMLFTTDWSAWGLPADPFVGGITLSGVHDLAPLLLFSGNETDFKLDAAEAERLSPVRLAPRTRAALLMVAGADETSEFVRQTRILWDAWPANRPPGARAAMLIPDRNHFNVVVDFAHSDSALTKATLALF
jgi:arylformamidase